MLMIDYVDYTSCPPTSAVPCTESWHINTNCCQRQSGSIYCSSVGSRQQLVLIVSVVYLAGLLVEH